MERLFEMNLEELLSDMRCLHSIRSMEHNQPPYRTYNDNRIESLLDSYNCFKQELTSYIKLAHEFNYYESIIIDPLDPHEEECGRLEKRKPIEDETCKNTRMRVV